MSKKLLLADDSITIQKVIQITFAHEDYELTITDNGDAALRKALEIRPDLIMSDIYMPGKNGYELTSAIKQDPALQHVPVLLLAGSFEPFDEDKARQCKADAWIEKPFESQSLIDKVAELLSAAASAAPAVAPVEAPAKADFVETATAAEKPPVAAAAAPMDEDPFGDISFEDEEVAAPSAATQAEAATAADDWSDLDRSPEPVAAPAAEDFVAAGEFEEEDFTFTEELPTDEVGVADDFTFVEEPLPEPEAADLGEDFAFAAEPRTEPEIAGFGDEFGATEESAATETAFGDFSSDEDEVMSLGDDDILGAEDLEPLGEEQTLSAWSRDTLDEVDPFAEPAAEFPDVEPEPVAMATQAFDPAVPATEMELDAPEEETAAPVAVETGFSQPAAVEDTWDEAAEPEGAEEALAAFAAIQEETSASVYREPAVETVAAVTADVEARAAAIDEEEIERIIEKVVSRIVEKLAGPILEKVAWEVVPDLAEGLIREEIRKIKDDAA